MELTELQEQQELVVNLFKDANGFKPRSIFSEAQWADMDFLQEQVEYLSRVCAENAVLDEAREQQAAVEFEATVAGLIAQGAGDRTTAIRWLLDAGRDDLEGLCWTFGLPWQYFKGEALAA